jgi:hypothetical protein
MRKRHGRILGSVAAVMAAGLAGFSLRPSSQPVTAVASRNPVEVKTQVIRRTIHIVHRQGAGHPAAHAAGRHGNVSTPGRKGSGTARSVRTGASRSHVTGSSAGGGSPAAAPAPVTTRTSASHPSSALPASQPSSGSPAAGPSPVTTRTSGSRPSSGSPAASTGTGSKPVTSRTSGGKSGGGDDKGDHGD